MPTLGVITSIAMVLEILTLAETHGIPMIKELLNSFNKTTLTRADVENLKNIKPFKEYFPEIYGDDEVE
jgi:hypothetical protein